MRFQFFHVSAINMQDGQDTLNRFCSSKSIASIDKQFVSCGLDSFWSICVQYVDGAKPNSSHKKDKVDYREVLSDSEFKLYSELRSLRKTLADKEGVPLYALFTNEQLAFMAQKRPVTITGIQEINGIGKARVEKYGEEFISLLEASCSKRRSAGEADQD